MAKQKVVILEMDPQVAGAYELFLAGRGFDVTVASTLAAAVRAVVSSAPEMVVVGNLPDSVGIAAAAERVRAVAAPNPMSIVALSPSMDEIERVDLVIPRGAHPRALLDAIRTVSRRRPATGPLATAS